MDAQIGWIGLGNMGGGMIKNISKKMELSKPILIYDINEARKQEIAATSSKLQAVDSITDVASKSDIIFFSVPDDKVVLIVLDEILKTDIKGKLIVDCSTIHPDTTNKEAETVESHGAQFCAAPVFGAAAMAESGQLINVLAGKPEAVDKVRPFCIGVTGRTIIDLAGEKPGQATTMKIVGNSMVLSMVESLSESMVLADKAGLGEKRFHQFIELMFPGAHSAYSNRMLTGDYYTREVPLFSVNLARKDAAHAQSLAGQLGMVMNNVKLADQYLEVVQKERGAVGELAAIYGAKRMESGLPFENQK